MTANKDESGSPATTTKAEMQIFSFQLSAVRESSENFPGSQVSYMLVYADSAAAFKACTSTRLCVGIEEE